MKAYITRVFFFFVEQKYIPSSPKPSRLVLSNSDPGSVMICSMSSVFSGKPSKSIEKQMNVKPSGQNAWF